MKPDCGVGYSVSIRQISSLSLSLFLSYVLYTMTIYDGNLGVGV